MDEILGEIYVRVNDQNILCASGDVCLNDKPVTESIRKVSSFYRIDSDLLKK